MANNGILLESGTNEVEILEFVVNGQPFGVNVLKIQAIEQYDPERVTQIQLSHPSVVGTLLFRDACITLIDLSQEMEEADGEDLRDAGEQQAIEDAITAVAPEIQPEDTIIIQSSEGQSDPTGNKLTLVMEFNDMKSAFLVDGVNRIHRVSWEAISPLSPFLASEESKFTGSMQIEEREILIVDMEKVVTEILPKGQDLYSVQGEAGPLAAERADVPVFLAEDSAIIRNKVCEELSRANYNNVRCFSNGYECYEAIAKLHEQSQSENKAMTEYVGCVISDIEMPKMDGLALCRNIKENLNIKELPVIMFSSLINDQIARKCQDVGSDAYITKPQFTMLVALLDEHALGKEPALA